MNRRSWPGSQRSHMVFSDGYASQLPTWSGTADRGIALRLNVGV